MSKQKVINCLQKQYDTAIINELDNLSEIEIKTNYLNELKETKKYLEKEPNQLLVTLSAIKNCNKEINQTKQDIKECKKQIKILDAAKRNSKVLLLAAKEL